MSSLSHLPHTHLSSPQTFFFSTFPPSTHHTVLSASDGLFASVVSHLHPIRPSPLPRSSLFPASQHLQRLETVGVGLSGHGGSLALSHLHHETGTVFQPLSRHLRVWRTFLYRHQTDSWGPVFFLFFRSMDCFRRCTTSPLCPGRFINLTFNILAPPFDQASEIFTRQRKTKRHMRSTNVTDASPTTKRIRSDDGADDAIEGSIHAVSPASSGSSSKARPPLSFSASRSNNTTAKAASGVAARQHRSASVVSAVAAPPAIVLPPQSGSAPTSWASSDSRSTIATTISFEPVSNSCSPSGSSLRSPSSHSSSSASFPSVSPISVSHLSSELSPQSYFEEHHLGHPPPPCFATSPSETTPSLPLSWPSVAVSTQLPLPPRPSKSSLTFLCHPTDLDLFPTMSSPSSNSQIICGSISRAYSPPKPTVPISVPTALASVISHAPTIPPVMPAHLSAERKQQRQVVGWEGAAAGLLALHTASCYSTELNSSTLSDYPPKGEKQQRRPQLEQQHSSQHGQVDARQSHEVVAI